MLNARIQYSSEISVHNLKKISVAARMETDPRLCLFS